MGRTPRYASFALILVCGLAACGSDSGENGAGGSGGTSGTGGVGGIGGTGGAGAVGGSGGTGGVAGTGGSVNNGPVIDYAGTVGVTGGVITAHGGRVVLEFPPGAVSVDTDIRVSPLANVGVPGALTPTAFDFGPDGTVFASAVTLTLSYNQSDIPAGVDETNDLLMVTSSHTTAEFVPVAGSIVDPVANTISATISGFSSFWIALPNCTFAGGLDPWCPPMCELPAPTYPDDPGGTLDTSFGTAGKLSFDLGPAGTTGISDLLIDDSGRLLLGASALRMAVIRILPNGEGRDPSFGDGGVALAYTQNEDSQGISIALRTDGRIILMGVRQPPGGGLNLMLARFMTDGTLDASFANDGILIDLRQGNTGAGQVATLPDGRILVTDAGERSIYQFLGDGSPDQSFGVDGIAEDPGFVGRPMLRRATGDWLLALGTGARVVDAQGTIGILYANAGPSGSPRTFEEIAGGQYVMGGFQKLDAGPFGPSDLWAARFRPGSESGSLQSDPCFAGNGAGTYDFGRDEIGGSLAVQSDGRIVLGGATHEQGNDDDDLFVARIRPDGVVDAGFGDNGIVFLDFGGDESGGSVAIDDQGRIVVAGSSRTGDPLFGDRVGVVARILP